MATLKISDLSVGDWVMCNEDKYRVMDITMFYELDLLKSSESFRTSIDNIHPIPITAEVLEKNGLFRHEQDDDNSERIVLSNHFMMARTYDDVEWWRVLIYNEEIPSEELFNGIVYSVHQLQHALRLAGIDKEINL